MKKALYTAPLLAALVAPLAFAGEMAPQASKAIDAAEALAQKAEEAGFIWKSTDKIINKAKQAAEKGDTDEAVELADKAKTQAELALKQAKRAENVKPHY